MKTPLASTPRLRALFAALVLLVASISTGAAEWITLQIPLTMATRSFTFWEEGSDGGTILPLAAPTDEMGYVLGDYSLRTSGVPILMGGSFDGNGTWHPNGSSYATISAYREGTGMFFLRDEVTNQLSPPDQTALLYADWRTIDASAPLRFVAFSEARHGHLLAFAYGSGGIVILTNGAVQKAIGPDGQEYSLGFFNAWATGIDPFLYGTPSSPTDGRIVDFTAQEAAWTSLNSNFLDASVWWSDPTPHSLQSLYLEFSTSEQGRQFDVYAGGSITRVVASSSGTAEGGAVLIGAGIEFHVVRVGSNGGEDGSTGTHQMPLSTFNFYANSELPPSASDAVLTTVHFRISPSLNPWGFSVDNNGTSRPITVSTWDNETSVLYPGTNTPVTIAYRDAWADVDLTQGYTVYDSGYSYLGQGPDFFEYPPAGTIASQALNASIPVARQGHGMRTGEDFNATWSTEVGQVQSFDPFASVPYSYEVASLSVPFSPNFQAAGASVQLTDLDTGEPSPAGAISGGGILGLDAWHVSQPLILKISGSRWSNTLQVRCADGAVFPIVKHRLQGDWSTDPAGLAWFNPYGFFDATATRKAGIPWHLYDATRGQYLNADGSDPASFINATDGTDTDGDGLKDWYEALIGTNPNNVNTDGDTQGNDFEEVTNGTNPLARPVTASGATLKVFTPLE